MPSIKVNMVVEVEDQFIADIITTMVESGGSRYWSTIERVRRDDDNDVLSFEVIENDELDEAIEDGMTGPMIVATMFETVTRQSIVDTLSKIMSTRDLQHGYVWDYIRQGVAEQDAGMFDADATDFILQIAVLDKVVYA